jgi:hypothetical protein
MEVGKDALLRNTLPIYTSGSIFVKSNQPPAPPVDAMSKIPAGLFYGLRKDFAPTGRSPPAEGPPAAGLRGFREDFLPFRHYRTGGSSIVRPGCRCR